MTTTRRVFAGTTLAAAITALLGMKGAGATGSYGYYCGKRADKPNLRWQLTSDGDNGWRCCKTEKRNTPRPKVTCRPARSSNSQQH
jgi:hypothetical protein